MLFSLQDEKEIVRSIKEAEAMSTGEIRVHLDQNLKGDALAVAQLIFYKLGMDKTKEKNGVLFYVSENEKKVAIIGDENIHKYVQQTFWDILLEKIIHSFKQNKYKEGLVSAILETGENLKKYFPADNNNNPNELPDDISRS